MICMLHRPERYHLHHRGSDEYQINKQMNENQNIPRPSVRFRPTLPPLAYIAVAVDALSCNNCSLLPTLGVTTRLETVEEKLPVTFTRAYLPQGQGWYH